MLCVRCKQNPPEKEYNPDDDDEEEDFDDIPEDFYDYSSNPDVLDDADWGDTPFNPADWYSHALQNDEGHW